MVDNKNNQWEDMEQTDNSSEEETYSYDDSEDQAEEYPDQDDNQNYEETYDEDYEEDEEEPAKKKGNPLILLIILLLLLGVIAFFVLPKFVGGGNNNFSVKNNASQQEQSDGSQTEQNSQASNDLADSFFDAAGGENSNMMSVNFNENGETNVETGKNENGDAQVATVTEMPGSEAASSSDLFDNQQQSSSNNDEEQENNAIMVVYNKVSKSNPFKPPVIDKSGAVPYETINDMQFEIIEPPVSSVPDENVTRLLQTQISGILYDDYSPSAIVNLNGKDQFVKEGDVISGYKVVSITKDKVQISYKNNSYVASVGELFTRGNLEKNSDVANLENKFAGRYKNNN